jgi:hypothetical protein
VTIRLHVVIIETVMKPGILWIGRDRGDLRAMHALRPSTQVRLLMDAAGLF